MIIKVHTVGQIVGGEYNDWYIFIQTYSKGDDVLTHVSNYSTFRFNREKDAESYDIWLQLLDHVEGQLEHWGTTDINWMPTITSPVPNIVH